MCRVSGGSFEAFLAIPRRTATVLILFLMLFLMFNQDLAARVALGTSLGPTENVDDAQGSGATAPLREQRDSPAGEMDVGDGGGRMRSRTDDVQGT